MEALNEVATKLVKDPSIRHFMVAVTLRHRMGVKAKALLDVLKKIISGLQQGHTWRKYVKGFIRIYESTFGKNGHHPHAHLILTLDADAEWDPEPFFEWIERYCNRRARKQNRTAEWMPGWWEEISPDQLGVKIGYLGKADKMGTALREVASASSKHQPMWCMPPKAYAELYRETKGMHWFRVGGCWSTPKTGKSDEELDQEREVMGEEIAHIPSRVFERMTRAEQRDALSVICDRDLTRDQVISFVIALGGGIGAPPDPWGGAEEEEPPP